MAILIVRQSAHKNQEKYGDNARKDALSDKMHQKQLTKITYMNIISLIDKLIYQIKQFSK